MSNRGMFQIDWRIWEELGKPHGFNVHHMLLLPDAYHVVKVTEEKISATDCIMTVYVESELIPDQLGVAELRILYGRKDGKACLMSIAVKGVNGWQELPHTEVPRVFQDAFNDGELEP